MPALSLASDSSEMKIATEIYQSKIASGLSDEVIIVNLNSFVDSFQLVVKDNEVQEFNSIKPSLNKYLMRVRANGGVSMYSLSETCEDKLQCLIYEDNPLAILKAVDRVIDISKRGTIDVCTILRNKVAVV